MSFDSAGPATDPKRLARLAQRVSGLVAAGFEGGIASDAEVAVLKTLAGAVLFARNVESAAQTRALVAQLQHAAQRVQALPLLIAIDQEGGPVSRLAAFGTTIPSAMALGAAADPALTESMYQLTGVELAALGITLDFAPVADVNSNPANPVIGIRSFGGDAGAVGRHVAAAVRGLHRSGVAATAKHFPGHGDTSTDSHIDLPVANKDLEELDAVEFEPFRAAMKEGVDAIMTAHVLLPKVDPSGTPATLSRAILSGILRDRLGFDGVVFTDCMQMKAIADRYSIADAAVAAIEAGADVLTYSSSLNATAEAIGALGAAVLSGRLDAGRIERSLERVEALRAKYAKRDASDEDLALVGSAEHRRAAVEAARRAITIVRDPRSILPLTLGRGKKIFLVQFGLESSGGKKTDLKSSPLAKLLGAGSARVQEQLRSTNPAGHEYKQLLMAAASADAIVAVTRDASRHPLQAQAVSDLLLEGKPLVVVAAGTPYDAVVAPEEAAVIASYGDADAQSQAIADALLGAYRPTAMLPVALPDRSSAALGMPQ